MGSDPQSYLEASHKWTYGEVLKSYDEIESIVVNCKDIEIKTKILEIIGKSKKWIDEQ